jgi:hypothetical protein
VSTALPSEEQRQRAEWDRLLLDIEHRIEQVRQIKVFWETPWGFTMIVLAFAATFAAGALSAWLWAAKTTTILLRFQ